jgi:hypothetical protein
MSTAVPLVLAGPILRQCEPGSVTVWFALQQARSATLRVYDANSDGSRGQFRMQGTANTVRIGLRLHVLALTAMDGDSLTWGNSYVYDVALGAIGTAGEIAEGAENMLTSPQVLGSERGSISYSPFSSPSFTLTPSDIRNLRLIHASCRKIHGEGEDAIAALDKIIADTAADPSKRPQALFLTGDQIYADDVADTILHHILFHVDQVVGPETLPGLPNSSPELAAGRRARATKVVAGFSSEKRKSHLFRFGEFVFMYLMSWSPALWPENLPDAGHV